MGTGPSCSTVATEMAMLAMLQDSQLLMFIPLFLMVTCCAGFAGAEIHNAAVVAALPGSLRTCFGTPSILTPSPSCGTPCLCLIRCLEISSGVSALDNTLVHGVGVGLSLQKLKSWPWVSQSRTHYRTHYRRGQGYFLSHCMAPRSYQTKTALQRLYKH